MASAISATSRCASESQLAALGLPLLEAAPPRRGRAPPPRWQRSRRLRRSPSRGARSARRRRPGRAPPAVSRRVQRSAMDAARTAARCAPLALRDLLAPCDERLLPRRELRRALRTRCVASSVRPPSRRARRSPRRRPPRARSPQRADLELRGGCGSARPRGARDPCSRRPPRPAAPAAASSAALTLWATRATSARISSSRSPRPRGRRARAAARSPLDLAQLARTRQQRFLQRRLAAAGDGAHGSIASPAERDHQDRMRASRQATSAASRSSATSTSPEQRLRQRPVRRIDLELSTSRGPRARSPARAARDCCGTQCRAAALLAARSQRIAPTASAVSARPPAGAARRAPPRRPAPASAGTRSTSPATRASPSRERRARGAARAAFCARLQLPQRIGPRRELCQLARALVERSRPARVLAVRRPSCTRWASRSALTARPVGLRWRSSVARPRARARSVQRGRSPRTRCSSSTSAGVALQLVATPLERLADVVEPRLVREGLHERVLRDLDGRARVGPAGARASREPALGGAVLAVRHRVLGDAARPSAPARGLGFDVGDCGPPGARVASASPPRVAISPLASLAAPSPAPPRRAPHLRSAESALYVEASSSTARRPAPRCSRRGSGGFLAAAALHASAWSAS